MHVTKSRVVRERADFPAGAAGAEGTSDSRPGTGGSGGDPSSRPGTALGSRPATAVSEVDVAMNGDDDLGTGLVGVEDGAALDEETKSSHDSARLLSHLGDVLSAKAEVSSPYI